MADHGLRCPDCDAVVPFPAYWCECGWEAAEPRPLAPAVDFLRAYEADGNLGSPTFQFNTWANTPPQHRTRATCERDLLSDDPEIRSEAQSLLDLDDRVMAENRRVLEDNQTSPADEFFVDYQPELQRALTEIHEGLNGLLKGRFFRRRLTPGLRPEITRAIFDYLIAESRGNDPARGHVAMQMLGYWFGPTQEEVDEAIEAGVISYDVVEG